MGPKEGGGRNVADGGEKPERCPSWIFMIILGLGPDKGGSVFIVDDVESPETFEFDSCVVKVFLMVRNVRRSPSL